METKIILADPLVRLKERLGIRYSDGKYNHRNLFIKDSSAHAHPYEMITNTFKHDDYAGSVQVNDILCLDPKFYQFDAQAAYPGQPIWIEKKLKKCDHFSRNMVRYAALTATAMTHVDLQDKYICDFGAGDGFLGLIALRFGARHVLAIEKDTTLKEQCSKHLALNGFGGLGGTVRFNWLSTDLQNMALADTEQSALSKVQVAVANIGPQYGNVHTDVIKMLGQKHMRNCTYFVGGGYSFEVGTFTAFKALQAVGFSIVETFTCEEETMEHSPKLLSFIAKRDAI